jgi:hypothetical protein
LFESNTLDKKNLKRILRKQKAVKNILALKILSDKINV